MEVRELDCSFTESDSNLLAKHFETSDDCTSFITLYRKEHPTLLDEEIYSLILADGFFSNNLELVNFVISLNPDSKILTTKDSEGKSPISVALTTNTDEELLYSLSDYLSTHKFDKIRMDDDTIASFKFSVYGGEFYSHEDTVNTYLAPLYDEEQVAEVLGSY